MEDKNTRRIVTYSNPFENKRMQDAIKYAMEHPESKVEDKEYAAQLSSENGLEWMLYDASTRRIHTWKYRFVDCDVKIVGKENENDGVLLYGFFIYKQVTVSFICVYEYQIEKVSVFTFKKVDNTDGFDFDSLVDEFLEEHTKFQYLYQS